MSGGLAIFAGSGALPGLLAKAEPDALVLRFAGEAKAGDKRARLEDLGAIFEALRRHGVSRVVLAGAMDRPDIDPLRCDALAAEVLPDLIAAMAGGDDALLRRVIALIEDQGFRVLGAHEIAPDLVATEGVLVGAEPSPEELLDQVLGELVLRTLAPLDISQAVVVRKGRVLAIETAFGTADMLASLKGRAKGGVLVKRAKQGQDLRADMPAIGPETVTLAAAAGISAIAIEAGRVLLLERDEVLTRARAFGLSIRAVR